MTYNPPLPPRLAANFLAERLPQRNEHGWFLFLKNARAAKRKPKVSIPYSVSDGAPTYFLSDLRTFCEKQEEQEGTKKPEESPVLAQQYQSIILFPTTEEEKKICDAQNRELMQWVDEEIEIMGRDLAHIDEMICDIGSLDF